MICETWSSYKLVQNHNSSLEICIDLGLIVIRSSNYICIWLSVIWSNMVLTWFIITFKPHWWSSTRGISQIWLQVREKSKIFKKSCAIFWQPAGSYCWNMAISEFVRWNPTTLMLFFHKNVSYESHWIFLGHQVSKIHPQK